MEQSLLLGWRGFQKNHLSAEESNKRLVEVVLFGRGRDMDGDEHIYIVTVGW